MKHGPFIPLQGPTGEKPKAPCVAGWQSPGYSGYRDWQLGAADRDADEWYGLRCDGLVVIDCDNVAAARAWQKIVGENSGTYVRLTPRGFHFIYAWTPGSPEGPSVGVLPDIDIRAGSGSQIVFYAPGYKDLGSSWDSVRPFEPSWLPQRKTQVTTDVDEWAEIPHGRGNAVMVAFAGTFRKQGMDERTIRTVLNGINRLCMTEAPMSREAVAAIAHSVCRYAPEPFIGEIEVDDTGS